MKSGYDVLIKIRSFFWSSSSCCSCSSSYFRSLSRDVVSETYPISTATTCSTNYPTQIENDTEKNIERCNNSIGVLKKWGCSDNHISKLVARRPSLRNADHNQLQYKLELLSGLGIVASDLVKIINCRPRFLSCRLNHFFDERLEYFMSIFGSREILAKAIIRNPSLLTYDFFNQIKPAVALYEGMGLSKDDLISMLLSRPTMIPRTSFGEEKIEYIRRTGVPKNSKMYKYVVTLIGISRLETIRTKFANLEKFGFTEDEVIGLYGRSPYVLTLSVDKVQRNMTFILGTMKLSAGVILDQPFLLYFNLEVVLKPRVFLVAKMLEMGIDLQVKGSKMLQALRMKETTFIKVYIKSHPQDVADELMEYYKSAKGVKRLAVTSKKAQHLGFPF